MSNRVQDLIITVRVRFPFAYDEEAFADPQEAMQFFITEEGWPFILGESDDPHLLEVQAVPSEEN